MFPVIDFRNGRYQGQTKQQIPNGLGCFMDRNFMFCIGQWIAGEINGNAIIIFPSGRIFCGRIVYRQMQGLCLFQLAEDHVQILTFKQNKRRQNDMQKMAAVLPLMNVILQIDNTNPKSARVINQYQYSNISEKQNLDKISTTLNLDKNGAKFLNSYKSFIQYFEDNFWKPYPQIFELLIQGAKGKKQYFLGLQGGGLGIKIQPNEQISLNMKQTGRVYFLRQMGYFTKDNVLKDIGIKMKDNTMKGVILQQGIFNIPNTIISYQAGKRPLNCSINIQNYIKRSLFYRDKILNTQYLFNLQNYVYGFNQNLRKVQTHKIAQQTIQNPNSDPQMLSKLQNRRRQKKQILNPVKQTVYQNQNPNPYYPTENKVINPEYNLNVTKDQIYRIASRKRNVPHDKWDQYKNVEYIDPNYNKTDKYKEYDYQRQPYSTYQRDPHQIYYPTQSYRYNDQQFYNSPEPLRERPYRYRQNQYKKDPYPGSLYPNRNQTPTRYRPNRISPIDTNSYYNYVPRHSRDHYSRK